MSFDTQSSSPNLDFIFMSSENEMIDHPGDDKPETESQAPKPGLTIETSPELAAGDDTPAEEFGDGWDTWMNTNPEEEDPGGSLPEPIADPNTEPSNEEPTEAAAEQNAEPSQEDTTEIIAEQNAESSQEEITETATEQKAKSNVEETTEAAEESGTVSDTDEKPDEQEREESPAPVEAEAPEATADESEKSDADEPEPAAPKPSKPKKVRRDGLTTEHVITYFAPCGRCGFFLSGYRAIYGLDALETAVSEAKSGWLTLNWGQEMQELILKSYGSRIEMNDLHFDGCCSECRRAFVYKSARSEKKPATFRIEIKPRKRQ